MTAKSLYIISITDAQNRMQSYRIAASTKAIAEAKACELAGVPADTEPATVQNTGRIDAEAD
jgi:hypothetical protein